MSGYINNRNKDINNTSISDSSEEDIYENSSERPRGKNGTIYNKNQIDLNDENHP